MAIPTKIDNLTEYDNPAWYDAENNWAPDDDYYLTLAKRIGGPVLDVACGTGRLTRAIAGAGIAITGIDLMAPMLARARALSNNLPISWIQADCRTMQLAQRFRLALMTGHAFQHLITNEEQEALLTTLHQHLDEGGRFAFEIRNPMDCDWMDTDWEKWRTFTDEDGLTVEVWTKSTYDQHQLLEYIEFQRKVLETGVVHEAESLLRYTDVEQLNTRLNKCGFTVVEQYGNWMRHPLIYDSPEIITVCQR
ncbi:MAG: methyltransferase domain-containing protein [Caldilineaceae bacterium]|nr:methyltransferase domain-containing protein [Caldilineaceae bacterium]